MKVYPEIIEAIKNSVQQAEKWGTGNPYLISGNKSYTLEEIIQEMEKGTDFGLKLQQGIFNLTIDLLSRQKETLNETEDQVQQ